MPSPALISGFTPLPFSISPGVVHYVYARAHEAPKKAKQSQQWPAGRTLFLVNVPPDATEREITEIFKSCGTIERVSFDSDAPPVEEPDSSDEEEEEEIEETAVDGEEPQRKRRRKDKTKAPRPPQLIPLPSPAIRKLRRTSQSAHVIFLDDSSLPRALVPSSKPRAWPAGDEEPSGLAHYTSLYTSLRPPLDAVRTHADSFMELFEFEQAKLKQKSRYKKGEAVVDEDGFTLVTRGGAYGQAVGGGVTVASKRFQSRGETRSMGRNRKKDTKEKANFYAFQKAEKQRSDLMKLRRDWESTKEQVEKLKASRKFKPY
ncbi:hypothetical protein CYLTODRAFT_439022 [Cylindrobasidium torrendii FP15055 ss-10]|uniref:RRM domain-containing protein n=1 Tax=Cylindrobasidium torrendii FP15055 ss-10 TaxID=1314674 RepID=A0A0D7AVH0_9AGAR|nr:hypothetical protein CYLTODRAFT_439022 [Cylindrobasidium torrendii FP15055 ss-10]